MKLFTKILTICLLIHLLASLNAYSQKRALTTKGDTVIVFSVPKAKWLLKQTYKVGELTTLDSLNKSELTIKDSIITGLNMNINDYKKLIIVKGEVIDGQYTHIDQLKKEIKRQKRYKMYAILGGAVSVIAVMIFL